MSIDVLSFFIISFVRVPSFGLEYIAALLCYRSLVAEDFVVMPITTGAVIVHQESTVCIGGYTNMCVQLEDGDAERQSWTNMFDMVESWIDEHMQTVTINSSVLLLHGVQAVIRRVSILRAGVSRVLSVRNKWGLFNFIGDLSSSLFGTATEEDLH